MKSFADDLNYNNIATIRRNQDNHPRHCGSFALLASLATILAVLSLSGCTGNASAAGAQPATTSTVGASPTSTPGTEALSASAMSVSFGNVSVGNTSTQSLNITNTGTAPVKISGVTAPGSAFTVAGGTTSSIPVGHSTTVQIQFVPKAASTATGDLVVTAQASGPSLTVSLSGTGIQPLISIAPASISFGNVPVGVTSTQAVTVSNTGNGDLSVTQDAGPSTGFTVNGLTLPLTVPPGQAANFSLSFTPTVAGSMTSSLALVSNAPSSPVVIGLTGYGTPGLAIATSSLAAGQVQAPYARQLGATGGTAPYSWSVASGNLPTGLTLSSTGAMSGTPSQSGTFAFSVSVTDSSSSPKSASQMFSINIAVTPVAVPTITTQPVNVTVTAGQAATFTVVANGTAPLSYRWYKNGVAVGTNSSTYTISLTATTDNQAQVQVNISNTAGNVTSNTATLTATTPTTGVSISAGTAIQNVVDVNSAGTTFVLQPGVFRMQSVTPKDNDTFVGQPGATLNGSELSTTFWQEMNGGVTYWVTNGPNQPGVLNGTCDLTHPLCRYPEDFFISDQPLLRVGNLTAVTAGACYFDYSAAKVYFVDDPTGKTVEIGVTTHAFSGSASNVTIKGLTIEKYAVPAQDGPISGGGWTIESNEIRLNHGAAIRLNSYQVIESNYIHHNGQEGLTGTGSNVLIQDNEIAYNNTLGFDYGWEAGGTKFSNMTNLVVQGNYVHDNKGPAFSLDFQNYNWIIQGNRTSGNYVAGILDEISYDGIARYNIIENDAAYPGQTHPSMWYACGFFNLDSQNAEVYGNTFINNSNGICAVSSSRGSGNRGAFEVHNLSAHDNVIIQTVGSASGAVASSGYYTGVYSTSWNNHWTSNTYKLSNSLAYTWMGGTSYVNMDSVHWQSFGQDTTGTWILPTDPTYPSTKFSANQTVHTLSPTQVWSLPTTSSTLVTTEASGAQGTVTQVAGPIHTSATWWWSVIYSDGKKGWSEETFLQ